MAKAGFFAPGEEAFRPEPDSPGLKAETRKLMAAAEDEIRRTMPKKIASQGPLYPPEVHAR